MSEEFAKQKKAFDTMHSQMFVPNPNPGQSWEGLWGCVKLDLEIYGAAYLWKPKSVKKVYRLDPTLVMGVHYAKNPCGEYRIRNADGTGFGDLSVDEVVKIVNDKFKPAIFENNQIKQPRGEPELAGLGKHLREMGEADTARWHSLMASSLALPGTAMKVDSQVRVEGQIVQPLGEPVVWASRERIAEILNVLLFAADGPDGRSKLTFHPDITLDQLRECRDALNEMIYDKERNR